jgi:hypothetical protein
MKRVFYIVVVLTISTLEGDSQYDNFLSNLINSGDKEESVKKLEKSAKEEAKRYITSKGKEVLKEDSEQSNKDGEKNVTAKRTHLIYKAGTLGLGVEMRYLIDSKVAIRGDINKFSYLMDGVAFGDNRYNLKAELESGGIIIDYRPWKEWFRLSTGVYKNNSSVKGDMELTTGNLKFGDRLYPSLQIGSVEATVDINDVNPYMGIGLASKRRGGWNFVADIGVLYIGEPKVKLKGTTAKGFEGLQPLLDEAVKAEEKKLNDELKDYKWYPVISVGMQYRF